MPLIKNSDLPTFDRLSREGRQVLDPNRASHQDIRELHIGFLNIMPDAALEAAERQFFRLIGESNKIVQIYLHPFTLPIFERSEDAKAHIEKHYETLEQIKESGIDALVITGANEETNPHVSDETTWGPLKDILAWAHENVTSTLCSCLASHAALTYSYGQPPMWRDDKRWGVYRHKVLDCSHPMVRGMNTAFDVPHSRYSEITRGQFEKAGMKILVESPEAGVHLATSADGIRLICFQGHPEYDMVSLLKEYRREVMNYIERKRPDYPPFPEHYFADVRAQELAAKFKNDVLDGKTDEAFPEEELASLLENTWADSARSAVGAWVGLVYQITNVDRKKPFMEGIDPNDPLSLKKA
ncbi:MAG: homoserine O-succinyltransferase [Micavibrio aeruginosavorus]|uniref:Homoserine O-succinyltransferase n=1 Tax=Micavibrio aeruginosavorus TaxID=349221 RepID=A0A2W5N5U6_9BACT|nr:MAG: homoserine O-succinyltransferase [Micavibrio aeruginosavorus]